MAFEWSKFQSHWHNGWETDLEETRTMVFSLNSLRQQMVIKINNQFWEDGFPGFWMESVPNTYD